MINNRQEQLDSFYHEIFGKSKEAETIREPIADLILEPDANPPQDKLEKLLENTQFMETWEHRRNFPSPSEYDLALASFAKNDDWEYQEIADLIIAFRRNHGETQKDREKALRPDYIQRIMAKVSDKDNKRIKMSTQLLEVIDGTGMEFFHTPDKVPYIVIKRDNHFENWPLESRVVRDYLARYLYEITESAPSSQTLQDVLTVLRGKALFSGGEEAVYIRLAEFDDKIYLDIGDSEWNVIEISAKGWRIVKESPIRFVRSRGMLALPLPQKNGDINELKRALNITEDEWPLLLGWLSGAFMPNGPFPVLVISGEQGSAKSTVAKMLRLLVDPSTIPLRALPKEERDLAIAARNAWLLVFDNVSYISSSLSDAICRLATGGGFATRELYANAEEVLFTATRPIIFNGIGDMATRSDLLDRTIFLTLPVISSDKRRTEAEIWEEFESIRPKILGLLLDAVSQALKNVGAIEVEDLPRMADFVKWVYAGISALGIDPVDFLEAYRWNIQDINQLALESSPAANAIMMLAANLKEGGRWEGTATELLERLCIDTDDGVQHQRDWPKNPRALSAILKRLAPNLRAIGVDVTYGRGHGEKIIYIRKGKQGYTTPRKRKYVMVTKLDTGGIRIQLNPEGFPVTQADN